MIRRDRLTTILSGYRPHQRRTKHELNVVSQFRILQPSSHTERFFLLVSATMAAAAAVAVGDGPYECTRNDRIAEESISIHTLYIYIYMYI